MTDWQPEARLRLRIDPAETSSIVSVGKTAWVAVEIESPGRFEGTLCTTSSQPAVVPLSETRTIWLPASGQKIRACVELLALDECAERVDVTIRVKAGRLLQQAIWSLTVQS